MNETNTTFGRRTGGYTTEEMAAYRRSLIAAADARQRHARPTAPISNEIQGLRGLARADETRHRGRSGRRLLPYLLLAALPVAAVAVAPSYLECGGRDRPFDLFVDEALRTCMGRSVTKRLHAFAASVVHPERSV